MEQHKGSKHGDYLVELATYPGPVKVLHDLDVGHLAVLSPGHSQEAEGHRVPQHFTSEEREDTTHERAVAGQSEKRKNVHNCSISVSPNAIIRSFKHREHIPGYQRTDGSKILWCVRKSCFYIHHIGCAIISTDLTLPC